DAREDMVVIPEILVARQGKSVSAGLSRVFVEEFNKLPRVADWQSAQYQSVDEAEDCRIGSDAQSQREYGNGRERGAVPHPPHGVSKVVPHHAATVLVY